MKNLSKIMFVTTVLLVLVVAVTAQDDTCSVDSSIVIETIETVCTNTGQNQACYGNSEVNAVSQPNAPAFSFNRPGDQARLQDIKSLFLSSLDPTNDTWGIAQLQLLAASATGTNELTILLFGDVSVENAVENTLEFDVVGTSNENVNVRKLPTVSDNNVIASIASDQPLRAVGRVEDTSWVRVILEESGAVGWVFADLVRANGAAYQLAELPVHDPYSALYSPMQAFYYSSGSGSATCGNMRSDGMLIQTPEGLARVSLLINEVSIELVSSAQYGATAFVTADTSSGMRVSMLTGSAIVRTDQGEYFVDANMSTDIPLNDALSANGAPSLPSITDPGAIDSVSLLPLLVDETVPLGTSAVSASAADPTPEPTPDTATTLADTPGNAYGHANGNNGQGPDGNNAGGNGNGNANGQGNGNANGQGRANGQANGNTNRK